MLVWSLGQEDPLEEEVATHPSILAWRIPWTEEPGGLQSIGSQRVRRDLSAKQQHTVVCFDKARKSPGTSRSPELDPGRGWFGVCGCAFQGSNALHAWNPYLCPQFNPYEDAGTSKQKLSLPAKWRRTFEAFSTQAPRPLIRQVPEHFFKCSNYLQRALLRGKQIL